jgi:hypothetical protein
VVFFGVVVVVVFLVMVVVGGVVVLGGGAVVVVVVGAAGLLDVGVLAAATGCTFAPLVPAEQPATAAAAPTAAIATQIFFTRT